MIIGISVGRRLTSYGRHRMWIKASAMCAWFSVLAVWWIARRFLWALLLLLDAVTIHVFQVQSQCREFVCVCVCVFACDMRHVTVCFWGTLFQHHQTSVHHLEQVRSCLIVKCCFPTEVNNSFHEGSNEYNLQVMKWLSKDHQHSVSLSFAVDSCFKSKPILKLSILEVFCGKMNFFSVDKV